MESDAPDDRPDSPKKKLRPSSTTSEGSSSGASQSQDAPGPSRSSLICSSRMNGVAPRRVRSEFEASSSSEISPRITSSEPMERPSVSSIQEEVVSSSVGSSSQVSPVDRSRSMAPYREGDADSLTNDFEDSPLNLGHEAEQKK